MYIQTDIITLVPEMSAPDAVPTHIQAKRIDLDSPRWDQSTFTGRFKHFASITNMFLSLKSDQELNEAKELLTLYRFATWPIQPKGF